MRFGKLRGRLGGSMLLLAVGSPCSADVFYEIVAPDGTRDWLLGTIHAEDSRVIDFPPALLQALRQVDTVALELAPDRAMLERLEQAMSLPPGETLGDRLAAPLYRSARGALVAEGVPEARAEQLRPWAAAMVLAQPPGAGGRFMDLALARAASSMGVEVTALETIDEQLAFFRGLAPDEEILLLRDALTRLDRRDEEFERIVSLYLDRDLEGLARLAARTLPNAPPDLQARFRQLGLDERNRRMVQRALPLLASDTVLIAVGALHLAGPGGLIARLRELGYAVDGIY